MSRKSLLLIKLLIVNLQSFVSTGPVDETCGLNAVITLLEI